MLWDYDGIILFFRASLDILETQDDSSRISPKHEGLELELSINMCSNLAAWAVFV